MISSTAIFTAILISLRFLFPSKIKRENISLSDSQFKKTFLFVYLLWIITGLIISGFVYWINYQIENISIGNFEYNLYPDTLFWIGSSAILGFPLAILITFILIKIILKEKSNEFWSLYDIKYKFKAFFILKVIIILFAILGVTLNYLGRNSHFKINSTKIEVSRLLEMSSQEFELNEIREIKYILTFTAPNGNIVNKPHYEIIFKNGYIWNTRMDLREPQDDDDKIFKELSHNSNVKIK
jgi:hypothetical protein